jgi:hypothetical protein
MNAFEAQEICKEGLSSRNSYKGCALDEALINLGSQDRIQYLSEHLDEFAAMPDFENIVADVWIGGEVGQFDLYVWKPIWERCDKTRLRLAGDPLPEQKTFVAYRGCTNDSIEDLQSDQSWTLVKKTAVWFATAQQRVFKDGYFSGFVQLVKPTVYKHTFLADDILFYTNSREENEIVIKSECIPAYAKCPKEHHNKKNNPEYIAPNDDLVQAGKYGNHLHDLARKVMTERGLNYMKAFGIICDCQNMVSEGKYKAIEDALTAFLTLE